MNFTDRKSALAQFLAVDTHCIDAELGSSSIFHHDGSVYEVYGEDEGPSMPGLRPDGVTCWSVSESSKYIYIYKRPR